MFPINNKKILSATVLIAMLLHPSPIHAHIDDGARVIVGGWSQHRDDTYVVRDPQTKQKIGERAYNESNTAAGIEFITDRHSIDGNSLLGRMGFSAVEKTAGIMWYKNSFYRDSYAVSRVWGAYVGSPEKMLQTKLIAGLAIVSGYESTSLQKIAIGNTGLVPVPQIGVSFNVTDTMAVDLIHSGIVSYAIIKFRLY